MIIDSFNQSYAYLSRWVTFCSEIYLSNKSDYHFHNTAEMSQIFCEKMYWLWSKKQRWGILAWMHIWPIWESMPKNISMALYFQHMNIYWKWLLFVDLSQVKRTRDSFWHVYSYHPYEYICQKLLPRYSSFGQDQQNTFL